MRLQASNDDGVSCINQCPSHQLQREQQVHLHWEQRRQRAARNGENGQFAELTLSGTVIKFVIVFAPILCFSTLCVPTLQQTSFVRCCCCCGGFVSFAWQRQLCPLSIIQRDMWSVEGLITSPTPIKTDHNERTTAPSSSNASNKQLKRKKRFKFHASTLMTTGR